MKGVFSRIFCDFGEEFICYDKNGEEAQEVMIESISIEEKGVVKLLEGVKHNFEDGDTICITKVDGMKLISTEANETKNKESKFKTNNDVKIQENEDPPKDQKMDEEKVTYPLEVLKPTELGPGKLDSINGALFKVEVMTFNKFKIGDTRAFSEYIRGGLAKTIKVPKSVDFKTYGEIYNTALPKWDENLFYHDFMKLGHAEIIHLGYLSLDAFEEEMGRLPKSYDLDDCKKFIEIAKKLLEKEELKDLVDWKESEQKAVKVLSMMSMTHDGVFGPQAAFIGGMVAQEVVKAITGKFMPINQVMYADCVEIMEEDLFSCKWKQPKKEEEVQKEEVEAKKTEEEPKKEEEEPKKTEEEPKKEEEVKIEEVKPKPIT